MPVIEQKHSAAVPVSKVPASKAPASKAPTAVGKSVSAGSRSADNASVCWIEVKHYPYQPDHQVELLHLQAEADALIIKLQAAGQKQRVQQARLSAQ